MGTLRFGSLGETDLTGRALLTATGHLRPGPGTVSGPSHFRARGCQRLSDDTCADRRQKPLSSGDDPKKKNLLPSIFMRAKGLRGEITDLIAKNAACSKKLGKNTFAGSIL